MGASDGEHSMTDPRLNNLSEEQRQAFLQALAGHNVFVSGPGGTGKSHVVGLIVDALQERGKGLRVAASTGIAALNIGGATIHSVLGTMLAGTVREAKSLLGSPSTRARARVRLERVSTLVIDEVSMLSGDYLEMMDFWLREVLGRSIPFAGKQLLLVGDFLQLPPVDPTNRNRFPYTFQAPVWNQAALHTMELRKSFRQDDQALVDVLNRVRYGEATATDLEIFAPCVGRKLENPLSLVPTNRQADQLNISELTALEGVPRKYTADFTGYDSGIKALKKGMVPEELWLKVGASVLLLKNNPEQGYVNGSRGVVTELSDSYVVVRLDRGYEVEVTRATWETKNGDGKITATMRQFPIRLAWAITIHKSQGMTLDNLRVDVARVFEAGQAYVALSRLRNLEGLSLDAPIEPHMIFAKPEIVEFYKRRA